MALSGLREAAPSFCKRRTRRLTMLIDDRQGLEVWKGRTFLTGNSAQIGETEKKLDLIEWIIRRWKKKNSGKYENWYTMYFEAA